MIPVSESPWSQPQPPSAIVLPAPGDRLVGSVWVWLLTSLAALALFAVNVPVLGAVYEVFVPVAFVVAGAHAASLLLAVDRPQAAIGMTMAATVATALLTVGEAGLPWPLPVVGLITQVLVCLLIALRHEPATAAVAVAGTVLAAGVPLLLTLSGGALLTAGWRNLVTFTAITVFVAALAVVGRRLRTTFAAS